MSLMHIKHCFSWIKKSFAISIYFLLIIQTAKADLKQYSTDKSHSYIGFEIEHFGFSRTVGRFNQFDGTFILDIDNKVLEKIDFEINVASLDTNHAKRDQHLLEKNFFNVTAFPHITFTGRKIVMENADNGSLEGDLTMLGVTKSIILQFGIRKIGTVPIPAYQKAETIGVEATGVLKRSEFGMDAFVGSIGDEIYLDIHLDLVDCNEKTKLSPACK